MALTRPDQALVAAQAGIGYALTDRHSTLTMWITERDAAAVSLARHMCLDAFRLWGLNAAAAEAELITSELVTNAVRHGAPPIVLALNRWEDTVDIDVYDAGTGLPRIAPAHFEGEPGGWGLGLVSALAELSVIAGLGKIVRARLAIIPSRDDMLPESEPANASHERSGHGWARPRSARRSTPAHHVWDKPRA
jgi:anti-sigma regulatory factor (Ser/Thr protein kinase)